MPHLSSFTLGEFSIRQHNGLFSLNDLHKASGGETKHQPAFFMRLDGTRGLIVEIQSAYSQSAFHIINGGSNPGTYACRELVIAYAAWISPAFHLKVIRIFLAATAPIPPQGTTSFQFGAHRIHVLTHCDNPWFVAKDIYQVLGYADLADMVQHLLPNEHRKVHGEYAISEFGLYSAIVECDSPDANRFQHWITREVLPTFASGEAPVATEADDPPEASFSIRQRDGLYSLRDLHAAAGGAPKHSPYQFKRRERTQRRLAFLDARDSNIHIARFSGLGYYLCREMVLEYADWVGDEFYLRIDSLLRGSPSDQFELPPPEQTPIQPETASPASNHDIIVDTIEHHIQRIHSLSYDYVSAVGGEVDIAYLGNPKIIRHHERQLALLGINREAIYSFFQRA